MKIRSGLAALLVAATLPSQALAATPQARSVSELTQLEERLSAALAAVDTARLRQLWAEDFVSTMADGRVTTGRNRLASLERQPRPPASHLSNRNDKVEVHDFGTYAVVLVTSTWVEAGQPVGEPYQATHVWAKRHGHWRLIVAHISEVTPRS